MEEAENETERNLGIWWTMSRSGDESFAWGSHESRTGVEELRRSMIGIFIRSELKGLQFSQALSRFSVLSDGEGSDWFL